MKAAPRAANPQEIELKLALPTSDPSGLAKRLSHTPLLARRKATHLHLHNLYYDTPELLLHQQRVALRLRRLGNAAKPKWLQTLKTVGCGVSALSQRGEWETPVHGAALSFNLLKDTPWSEIDPDGAVFAALAPAFETNFDRTSWLLSWRDGSVVEVALDIGQIVAGAKHSAICELELELKAGPVTALFEVAQQIAQWIALLPTSMSKTERGYALRQNSLGAALGAQTHSLRALQPLPEIMQQVLREMFSQFTSNLNQLMLSDDPELVHQARVGWRRFNSAVRFFRPLLVPDAMPCWQALKVLLVCLGHLRDLDVARTQTLPPLAQTYGAENPSRFPLWQHMLRALAQAACMQRKAVRYALQEPATGASLLATTRWLESLTDRAASRRVTMEPDVAARPWVRERIRRLHRQLKQSRTKAKRTEQQHRVRILAKRMRYNLAALQALLPRKLAQRWLDQANKLQTKLGTVRDATRAAALVAELDVDRSLIQFLTAPPATAQ